MGRWVAEKQPRTAREITDYKMSVYQVPRVVPFIETDSRMVAARGRTGAGSGHRWVRSLIGMMKSSQNGQW